jgi:hypothetical protein
MRLDPLLFSSFDMPYGDECDIPKAIIFGYWIDIANRVADPNNLMVFEAFGLTRWGILNNLPYWSQLKICHLLDPMHIEKNVGKAIIKRLYGEKDNIFRKACEALERHPYVWISVDPITSFKQRPSAPWTFTIWKRKHF